MPKKNRRNAGLPDHYVRLKLREQIRNMAEREGIGLEQAEAIIMERKKSNQRTKIKGTDGNKSKQLAGGSDKSHSRLAIKKNKKVVKKKKAKKIDMLDCWWSRLSGSFEGGKN